MSIAAQRPQQRTVVLVTPDHDLRERVAARLQALHWTVQVAAGGAEALALLHGAGPEAVLVDHWLPDLQPAEFLEYVATLCPATDLLHMDGGAYSAGAARSMRRNELQHVLRAAADAAAAHIADFTPETIAQRDTAARMFAPGESEIPAPAKTSSESSEVENKNTTPDGSESGSHTRRVADLRVAKLPQPVMLLPDVVGTAAAMQELSRMVRLVAPHPATVLVLGETGTGKELVAKAVHRLSARSAKPFMVLNCAAIPEQLLEAELFGHTRGAFTGAVTSRMGRIEAAHGGTLFLDEIGEMPLALQAKMLRFLENGEVQRVGDNETSRVDVRIVAATHQPLLTHAQNHRFRLDLYHRLAVFPVEIPPLRERPEDIPMLVGYLLAQHGGLSGQKTITYEAMECLRQYSWNGNVRELGHVIHRAIIVSGHAAIITSEHLRMRGASRG